MSATMRDYQVRVVNQIATAIENGVKSILLVAPTGSGKTRMISEALRQAGGSCLALAHRVEICRQIEREFAKTGPENHKVMGVGSLSVGPAVKSGKFRTLFVDEAHHIPAASYRRIVENRGNMIMVGATATPYRRDGAALSPYFDVVVNAPSVADLSRSGHLARVTYVASDEVDYRGIRISKQKEFDQKDALNRVRIAVQAGDLVQSWSKYARGRNALIYAINLEHCQMIQQELDTAGVRAAIVSSRTGKRDRTRIIADFEASRLRAVINCEVFTEGTDLRGVGAIIMLRPTNSRALYKQMIGRGMRPDGECVVLDHVGNFLRHGNVLQENPEEAMKGARLIDANAAGSDHRSLSVNVLRMDLHVEKVDATLSSIWAPAVFAS